MRLKQLLTDDDAVSPVIGVILMVAITVILAAVIGAFVLGIGGDQESAPQVTWDVSEDTTDDGNIQNVTFTHNGGDAVQEGLLTASWDGNTKDAGGTSRLTAGSGMELNLYNGGSGGANVTSGSQIRVIWSPDGSDDTNVIGTHSLTAESVEQTEADSSFAST